MPSIRLRQLEGTERHLSKEQIKLNEKARAKHRGDRMVVRTHKGRHPTCDGCDDNSDLREVPDAVKVRKRR